jgi:hypothetical protein
MVFQVQDYHDLVKLLSEHPEWQAELRRLLLIDDLLELPAIVHELAEAQKSSEARLDRLEAAIVRLEATVQSLVEAQRRTEESVKLLADRQGEMRGTLLELRYAQRAQAYFGRLLRRIRTVLPGRLDASFEDTLESHLTEEELEEIFQLDVLVVGRLRKSTAADMTEVWLAVEVSGIIDKNDVERALHRAALLRKAGYRVVPVVAGQGLTLGATQALQDAPVALVLDGRSQGWDEALRVA